MRSVITSKWGWWLLLHRERSPHGTGTELHWKRNGEIHMLCSHCPNQALVCYCHTKWLDNLLAPTAAVDWGFPIVLQNYVLTVILTTFFFKKEDRRREREREGNVRKDITNTHIPCFWVFEFVALPVPTWNSNCQFHAVCLITLNYPEYTLQTHMHTRHLRLIHEVYCCLFT